MSPGHRVTRASAVKGKKQKVVETTRKKNTFPRHALPMFNDPVSSPVLPKYFERASLNLPGNDFPGMVIINRSAWLELYPDPWHPTIFPLVKTASETNLWYSFLYDIFLDGKLSRWGDGSSNVLYFLIKFDILRLMRICIDLVPLMTYTFVFACLTCLWKTPLEKDRLQVLVDAIKKQTTSGPKSPPLFVLSLFFEM
jgi:hypothetical protein